MRFRCVAMIGDTLAVATVCELGPMRLMTTRGNPAVVRPAMNVLSCVCSCPLSVESRVRPSELICDSARGPQNIRPFWVRDLVPPENLRSAHAPIVLMSPAVPPDAVLVSTVWPPLALERSVAT